MSGKKASQVGSWSFIVAIGLAILVGLFPNLLLESTASTIFVVLGLIVGFLNISPKETNTFLIATIALISVGSGSLSSLSFFSAGTYLTPIVSNIIAVSAPAALIVALRSIYDLGKNEDK